jgi:hypothetical protein
MHALPSLPVMTPREGARPLATHIVKARLLKRLTAGARGLGCADAVVQQVARTSEALQQQERWVTGELASLAPLPLLSLTHLIHKEVHEILEQGRARGKEMSTSKA